MGQEEEKRGAELALEDGLKRGKTSTFKEAIEHATAIGLEDEKIQMAEKKLEDHKAFRRREAFEAELHDFLRTEDAEDIDSCKDKLSQGKEYGVGDKVLKLLQDQILHLELMKDLNAEEIEQAKLFLELCTRRFVASCVAKGRDVEWIDLESGSKHKVVVKMDLTLKNFTVAGPPAGDLSCKVDDIMTQRAVDSAEVSSKNGFSQLADADRENSVALMLKSGNGPWCFRESTRAKQDEFLVAFQVFNGLMPAPVRTNKRSPRLSPRSPRLSARESNLRNAAEGEEPTSPVSPRKSKSDSGAKEAK